PFAVDPMQPAPQTPLQTSTRVNVESGQSSDGEHQERYAALDDARRTGRPWLAWGNPDHPEEAMLFREPGALMVMMIPGSMLFMGLGGWLIFKWRWISAREKKRRELAALQPARRWRWEPEWARGFAFEGNNVRDFQLQAIGPVPLALFLA